MAGWGWSKGAEFRQARILPGEEPVPEALQIRFGPFFFGLLRCRFSRHPSGARGNLGWIELERHTLPQADRFRLGGQRVSFESCLGIGDAKPPRGLFADFVGNVVKALFQVRRTPLGIV